MERGKDWEIKRREFRSHTLLFFPSYYRVDGDGDVDVNDSEEIFWSIFCVKGDCKLRPKVSVCDCGNLKGVFHFSFFWKIEKTWKF